jgi:DNA polymerase I-like protein with 3'-5' exonuclease and polymerase domains
MLDFTDTETLYAPEALEVSPPLWVKDCSLNLVNSNNISSVINELIATPFGKVAIDLETTGLDRRIKNGKTVASIVGICLCADPLRAFYIPVAHKNTTANVPWPKAHAEMQRLIKAIESSGGALKAIFHNAEFDQDFLQFNGISPLGEWEDQKVWDDTLIMSYLNDSKRFTHGLKVLSAELNPPFNQLHIEQLFPKDTKDRDFSTLDPLWEPVLWYTTGDALATFRIHSNLHPKIVEKDTDGKSLISIFAIEKHCLASTRWMVRNGIHIDRDRVFDLIKMGHKEWYDAIMELYAEAQKVLNRDVMPGVYKVIKDNFKIDDPDLLLHHQLEIAARKCVRLYPDKSGFIQKDAGAYGTLEFPYVYDLNSPQQLGMMFAEIGVPGLQQTEKSQQFKTSKEVLDQVIAQAEDDYPFLKYVKRFREIAKVLSSYLYPMHLDYDPDDSTIHISFKQLGTETGRFSTPSSEGSVGKPKLNLQSLPSANDPKKSPVVTQMRSVITPRKKDSVIVAVDLSGVELRIATNLSKEPLWLAEFFRCSSCSTVYPRGNGVGLPPEAITRCVKCNSDKIGDLHTKTALAVYGDDAINRPDWKALRGNGKGTNFSLLYGGGPNAVVRSVKVSREEGQRIKRRFDDTYKILAEWWEDTKKFARQHMFVRTSFGRKYPLPDINSEDRMLRSAAERNAVNAPIQGENADMVKISMGAIYREVKNRGWLDKVFMIITIHDELVFEIDNDILDQAIDMIVHQMTRNRFIESRNYIVPYTSDIELGPSWMVPWDWKSMKYGEVRFDGDKKYKDAKSAQEKGLDWDQMLRYPKSLSPYADSYNIFKQELNSSRTINTGQSGFAMDLSNDDPFVFIMDSDLTVGAAINLADYIIQSASSDGQVILVKDKKGNPIHLMDKIRVDVNKFTKLYREGQL